MGRGRRAERRSLLTKPNWLMRKWRSLRARRLISGRLRERADDTVGWALWEVDSGEGPHEFDMPSLGETLTPTRSI